MFSPKFLILMEDRLLAFLLGKAVQCRCPDIDILVDTCETSGLEKIVYQNFNTILICENLFEKLDRDLLLELKAHNAELSFTMLCTQLKKRKLHAFHEKGITGFVTYDNSFDQVIRTILNARGQNPILAPQTQAQNQSEISPSTLACRKDIIKSLTLRELEIFTKVGQGCSIHEIAKELGVSAKTVTVHKSNIGKKTGLNNNQKIIRWHWENETFDIADQRLKSTPPSTHHHKADILED